MQACYGKSMKNLCLESMADDRLLERVEVLAGRSNEITAELLAYLGEADARGLHLGQACSSLFAFCVERLHMSESAAGKRITAARVARRFPVVLEMIAGGQIHLTAVNMLAAHLTEENHIGLLARARHQGKRQIEKLVAELAPRPDVPSRVVALSQRVAAQEVHAPERVVHAPERVADAPRPRPAVIAPLSPRRYEIRVTVDEETHDKLRQLQALAQQVPDRDPAVIVSRALELLLARTLARKAALTDRPRDAATSEERTRHIPAAVRRAVWQRDKGQCAFVDGRGRRCSSTRSLEFHHVNNWGRGAEHDPSEVELRCRSHNQYQAVLDYGAAFMAAKKAAAPSRAGQPRRQWLPSAGARERGRMRWGSPQGGFPKVLAPRSGAMPTEGSAHVRARRVAPATPSGERKRAPPRGDPRRVQTSERAPRGQPAASGVSRVASAARRRGRGPGARCL